MTAATAIGRAGEQTVELPDTVHLYYVGRRRELDAPAGAIALTSWDVLPVALAPLLEGAGLLTVRDPMSFPFDALGDDDRDVPLVVELAFDHEAEEVVALLGTPLLEHLTPYDRVVAPEAVWETLRARYIWPLTMRASDTGQPPARREQKASYRRLRHAMAEQLGVALSAVPVGERPRVLFAAERASQWAPLVAVAGAELIGVCADDSDLVEARRSFSEWRFERNFPPDPEVAHVAVSVGHLCSCGQDLRQTRIRSLLRSLRVGGRLVVLDRFLEGRGGSTIGAPGPRSLVAEIAEVSAHHLALAHVEAIRLKGDDLTSHALFTFTKLGRPERL